MHNQKGITITGMIITCVILGLIATMAFKVVPAILEYKTIERQMQSMADDPMLRNASRADLNRAWAMRAAVDNMPSVSQEQLEYTKEGNGWKVSADYSKKIPLFANVSLWLDFHATSK